MMAKLILKNSFTWSLVESNGIDNRMKFFICVFILFDKTSWWTMFRIVLILGLSRAGWGSIGRPDIEGIHKPCSESLFKLKNCICERNFCALQNFLSSRNNTWMNLGELGDLEISLDAAFELLDHRRLDRPRRRGGSTNLERFLVKRATRAYRELVDNAERLHKEIQRRDTEVASLSTEIYLLHLRTAIGKKESELRLKSLTRRIDTVNSVLERLGDIDFESRERCSSDRARVAGAEISRLLEVVKRHELNPSDLEALAKQVDTVSSLGTPWLSLRLCEAAIQIDTQLRSETQARKELLSRIENERNLVVERLEHEKQYLACLKGTLREAEIALCNTPLWLRATDASQIDTYMG